MEVTESQATTPQYYSLDMPLSVFIDAIVDGKIDAIKDFERILLDYTEAIGWRELVIKLNDLIELEELKHKIAVADCGIELLKYKPSRYVYEKVYELGYNTSIIEYNESKMEAFITQIQPFVELDRIDCQVLQNANKKTSATVKYTHGYFAELIVKMEIVLRCTILETVSLRKYCAYVVRYKEHLRTLKQTQE